MGGECRDLSDDQLEKALTELAGQERALIHSLLLHLGEYDHRRLAERRGYPSLWIYCTKTLGFTENEAWVRIQAARALRKFRPIEPMVEHGELNLCGLARLYAHLTEENHVRVLRRAVGLSVREIDAVIAEIAPRPDIADCVQRLPGPSAMEQSFDFSSPPRPAPPPPDKVEYLAPERVHFGFTADKSFDEKVRRAKSVLWHKFPQGLLEDVFDQALDDLLDKRDPARRPAPRRTAQETGGRPTRYIPRWVRADVWKRDGGCCAFVSAEGVRCGEESALEYDHVVPFAEGGASDEPSNIRLLCRAHNQLLAADLFGAIAARHRKD